MRHRFEIMFNLHQFKDSNRTKILLWKPIRSSADERGDFNFHLCNQTLRTIFIHICIILCDINSYHIISNVLNPFD